MARNAVSVILNFHYVQNLCIKFLMLLLHLQKSFFINFVINPPILRVGFAVF